MSRDVILKVEGLSKKFCRSLKRSMIYAGEDLLRNFFGMASKSSIIRNSEFWAIEDISFELKRGESLGLLGVNGSGKSTLLRLIAGLFPPDNGSITVKGKVASMIAVGSGFHPHMTGRENIYLNASILGMSQEFVANEFQSIVDFAEIGNFLDAPVATYSSGMRVRLGFAIASASKPDLLLLDEILAVGDRQFKVKCFNRIAELQATCAVVFVSHNVDEIARICDKVCLIEKSKLIYLGDVSGGIEKYLVNNKLESRSFINSVSGFELDSVSISKQRISWKEGIEFEFSFNSAKEYKNMFIRITFHDENGRDVANWQSYNHGIYYDCVPGKNTYKGNLEDISLKSGQYFLSFVLSSENKTDYLIVAHECANIMVNSVEGYTGYQI